MGGASLSACCPIRGGRPHTRASGSEGRQPLHCPHMRNVMGSAQWHPAAGSKRAREVAVPSRLMAVAAQTLNRGLRQQRRNAGCAMTPSSRIECDQKQSDAAAQEPRAAAARRRGRASCACAAPTCFASTGTARTRPRPPSTRTAGSGARSPLPLPSCSTRAACYMRGKRCCVDAQWEADMAACTEHALYPVVLSPFHRGLAAVTHRLAAVLHGLTATRRPKRTRVSVHCLARDPKHRGCDTAHCIHLCPGAQDRRHMRPGRRPALLAHPGRTSVDIIKSAGYKISALGIENVLLAHPAVAECAVVGLPDDALGERVAAVVACKDAPVSAPLPPGASARRPARPPGEDTRGATWRDSVPPHAPHVGSEPPRQRPGYPASSHAPHVRCQPPRQRCFRAAAMHRLHEQQMASLATCVLET